MADTTPPVPINTTPSSPVVPPPEGTLFTRDPVTITTTVFTFLLGVISLLLVTDVLNEQVGGVLAGVTTAAWAAVQMMFVRPATVPRQPLEELAAAKAIHPMTST